jgi:hypothetical protein
VMYLKCLPAYKLFPYLSKVCMLFRMVICEMIRRVTEDRRMVTKSHGTHGQHSLQGNQLKAP